MVPLPLLGPAGHALSAVAALEELQAVSAFPAVARAHLARSQHGLADARPEVSGAAEALGAICGPQAGVAFHSWEKNKKGEQNDEFRGGNQSDCIDSKWLIMSERLTFHSVRLIAVCSWRHSGVMLSGAVVFVPTGDDGRICSVYVQNLANTWTWQRKEKTT